MTKSTNNATASSMLYYHKKMMFGIEPMILIYVRCDNPKMVWIKGSFDLKKFLSVLTEVILCDFLYILPAKNREFLGELLLMNLSVNF